MEGDLAIESVLSVFEGEFNTGFIQRDKPRASDAFVLYTAGAAEYIFEDGRILAVKEGDVFYLPGGSVYNIDVKKYSKYICIDFFFKESASVLSWVVCRSANMPMRGNFVRAFHNWLRNDPCRLPKAYAILYDIYASMIYETSRKYTKSSDIYLKAAELILQSYNDADFSIERLCKKLTLSTSHVRRVFGENAGISPIKYLNYVRCEQAKNMLTNSNLSIGEIANSVGFSDALYFSRMFKKSIGISPLEYRKQNA